MLLKAYSLFDAKALVYSPPWFRNADAIAIRDVAALAADPQTTVGQYPEDFHLYRIGSFNDATGFLDPQVVESLGVASQFLRKG